MKVEREVITDSVKHKDVFHISGKGWFRSVDDEAPAIGPFATEDEAILALQSTLRKMAELEVAE